MAISGSLETDRAFSPQHALTEWILGSRSCRFRERQAFYNVLKGSFDEVIGLVVCPHLLLSNTIGTSVI